MSAAAAPVPTAIPAASLWRCFGAAHAALAILWMPWALLKQVDAFLGFLTPIELLRDVALALLVLAVPALAIAMLATLGAGLARRLGAGEPAARAVAWGLLMVPVGWVCVWQFGSAGWAWLRTVSGTSLSLNSNLRVGAAVALLLLAFALGRKGRWRALLGKMVQALLSLRGPALLALALSCGWLLLQPPRLLGPADAPAVAPAAADRPDVFLITIDTLAAQDAMVCGDGPTLMPRLREFARQATCFDRHYASANFTTPSTATMETGALPWTHWGVQIVAKMSADVRDHTLARRLREQGYETHSISANLMASPRHHGSFAHYDTDTISPSPSLGLKPRQALTLFPDTTLPFWLSGLVPFLDTLDVYRFAEHNPFPPELSYSAAKQQLAQARRPVFMWVHTLPPHDPYLAPEGFKYQLLPQGELDRWSQMLGMGHYTPAQQAVIDKHRLRYRESIMAADAALGRFLDDLRQSGRLDKAVVAITSDHGESFEHGFMGHAGETMNEGVLRVPLVIKLPGQNTGRVVSQPVSLADVAPTLADLAGAGSLAKADGRSLKPALIGEALPARPVLSMAMERQSRFAPIRQGHYVLIAGDHKLTYDAAARTATLHDLAADPRETTDLMASQPELGARLRADLEARLAKVEQERTHQFGGAR